MTSTGSTDAARGDEAEPSFEEILARLQKVVEKLEQGDLPLERSLAIFEEGIRLSRLGARRLDDAETRIEELLADEDGPSTRPLGANDSSPSRRSE